MSYARSVKGGNRNKRQKREEIICVHLKKGIITFGNGRAGLQWMQAISATFGRNGREYDTLEWPFCSMKLTLRVKSYTFGTSLPK